MPEGRRYSPQNPSPAMVSFANYIREEEGADSITNEQVAYTFVHHRDWQTGHAKQLVTERAEAKVTRDAEAEKKKAEREAKKAQKDEDRAKREAEAEEKKAAKEEAKAAKEAEGSGADGDDSDSATPDAEGRRTRRRLNTKDEAQEPVAAGVSEASF